MLIYIRIDEESLLTVRLVLSHPVGSLCGRHIWEDWEDVEDV